jgi:hypothetical protein
MKTIWIIFKKDARRFWPLLAAWIGILTVSTTLLVGRIDIPPDSHGFSQIDIPTTLAEITRWLVMALLAAAFIQEDGLVGDRAFWMTRPIAAGSLVAAKLLDLVVWILLPSAAAYAWGTHWLGTPAPWLIGGDLYWLLLIAAVVLPLAAFAAITANLIQLGAALITALFVITAAQFWAGTDLNHTRSTEQVALDVTAILFGLGAILLQAIGRRRGPVIVLLCVGALVARSSAKLWPFGEVGQHPQQLTPVDQIRFQWVPAGQDRMAELRGTASHPDVVTTVQRIGGSRETFLEAYMWEEAWFETAGRRSHWSPPQPPYASEVTANAPAVLGWAPLRPESWVVWSGNGLSGQPFAGKIGRLEESFSMREMRPTPLGEIPLRVGAAIRANGISVRILRIDPGTYVAGPRIAREALIYFELHYPSLWNHSVWCYVVNRSRREVAAAQSYGRTVFPGLWATNSLLAVDSDRIPGNQSVGIEVNNDWLAGASLVMVDMEALGDARHTLVIDGFTIPTAPTNK